MRPAHQVTERIVAANHPGRNFDVQTRSTFRATPARNVRSRQAARIPVNLEHDRAARVGSVIHLEMAGRHLWAVAELDDDLSLDAPRRFSVETTSSYKRGSLVGTDVEVTGVGIVERSAQTCIAPIRIFPGSLDQRSNRRLPRTEQTLQKLAENAAQVLRDRRHGRPILGARPARSRARIFSICSPSRA